MSNITLRSKQKTILRSLAIASGFSVVTILNGCFGGGGGGDVSAPSVSLSSCPITNSSIDSLVTKGAGLAFNGASFGSVGTYTYILAEATAKVSAKDACADTIVDLKNAADSAGNVTYKFDVVILTPTDASKASGTLLYEVNNRSNNVGFRGLVDDKDSNNFFDNVAPSVPATATGAVSGVGSGNGFVMKQGMTYVTSGWQGDRPQTLNVASASINSTTKYFLPGMTLPVAYDVANGGARITGKVQDEFIADTKTLTSNKLTLAYKMAPGSVGSATLTIQKTPTSTPIIVSSSRWTYTADSGTGYIIIDRTGLVGDTATYAAALDAGSDAGSIYHFNYTAIDPSPYGLGFLGVRDLVSYLKYGTKDNAGNANPLAGRVKTTIATGVSQSGRFLRDFLWQGFNTDANLKQVFDGMLPLVTGARRTYTNYRFAKPGDYSRQHETHYALGDQFPFTYATITDPLTGKTDGLLKKCTERNTCPKIFQYDSPLEFTGARASLNVTDGAGKEVSIPSNVRLFYATGTVHSLTPLSVNASVLPDYSNPVRTDAQPSMTSSPVAINASTALYRALLVNLEGWVKGTKAPLDSKYPSVADGTMAVPTSAPSSLGRPDLAALGLGFNGVYNTLSVNDESVIPVVPSNKFYVIHLPTTDAQGNEKAGVKMPDTAVPLATFAGYNLRKSGFVAGNQSNLNGAQIPFALLTASKSASDPRKSIQELYGTKSGYISAMNSAVDTLLSNGYMLPDDAEQYRNRATMQSLQPYFSALP